MISFFRKVLRVALPALANNLASLVKDSSLAYAISVVELTMIGYRIQAESYQPIPVFITTAVIYLILTTAFTTLTAALETQLDVGQKRQPGQRMKTSSTPQPIIIARNVDKRFGTFYALRGVSASFSEGQVTAIIGPSGSENQLSCAPLTALRPTIPVKSPSTASNLTTTSKTFDTIRAKSAWSFRASTCFHT